MQLNKKLNGMISCWKSDDNRGGDRYGRDRRNWGGQSSSDRRWRNQPNSSQWMHNRGNFPL